MKDALSSDNSWIVDRSWLKVNPSAQLALPLPKAAQFLSLLTSEYAKLRSMSGGGAAGGGAGGKAEEKIHSFMLKFIQQKELSGPGRRELPFVREDNYQLDLRDCLEIWRWLSEDENYPRGKELEEEGVNEFDLTPSPKAENRRSEEGGKEFGGLSLEEQEGVMRKSLEMVHMYYYQLRIVFTHYCRLVVENEHKRTHTFDDFSLALDILPLNRFMLFCRDFDVIKTVEFKRKTERNPAMSKQLLLDIFRKTAHLQKHLNFDGFLLAQVLIAMKLHANFDPRSYMHVELYLNSLKVKYYEQFVAKLRELGIKYSQSDFYNCYRNIFKKREIRSKQNSLFNNPHFGNLENTTNRESRLDTISNISSLKEKQFGQGEPQLRSHLSVPNLQIDEEVRPPKKPKTLSKYRSSVPQLPSLSENRYFKPIEHNHHRNAFSKYLEHKVDETSSSVFKNRITGYTNINHLRSKPFHMTDNPEAVTSDKLGQFMTNAKRRVAGSEVDRMGESGPQYTTHPMGDSHANLAARNSEYIPKNQ